jgi:hypothetical protein
VGTVVWRGNQRPQHEFLRDLAPGWTAYQGGFGAGKTWAGSRKLLTLHWLNDCPSLIVAPTYGDLWKICVPAILEACDEAGVEADPRPHGRGVRDYPHIMVTGEPIILASGDAPDRIAGYEVGGIWCDEGCRLPESQVNPRRDAPTQIRARLRHPKAQRLHGLVTTTPEGTETWVQRDWIDKAQPSHRIHFGRTVDNRALSAEYAAGIRAAFGAELAEQYLDGRAVDYRKDRAHPTFTAAAHVGDVEWLQGVPVRIGMDFNVAPMCWVACQLHGSTLAVLDEIVAEPATVDQAVHLATDRKWHMHGPVVFHPDRSAANRNRVGDPEFTVAMTTARADKWNISGDCYGANPPINHRINHLSRMIMDGAGQTHIRVHPRCRRLIDEMLRTGRKGDGYQAGTDGKRGHILDALGYVAWDTTSPGGKATAANWHL